MEEDKDLESELRESLSKMKYANKYRLRGNLTALTWLIFILVFISSFNLTFLRDSHSLIQELEPEIFNVPSQISSIWIFGLYAFCFFFSGILTLILFVKTSKIFYHEDEDKANLVPEEYREFIRWLETKDKEQKYHVHSSPIRLKSFNPRWPINWSYPSIFLEDPPFNLTGPAMVSCFVLLVIDSFNLWLFNNLHPRIPNYFPPIPFSLFFYPIFNLFFLLVLGSLTVFQVRKYREFRKVIIKVQKKKRDKSVLSPSPNCLPILFHKSTLKDLEASPFIPFPGYVKRIGKILGFIISLMSAISTVVSFFQLFS
ncbi:MAG: hypothetical protein ACFE9L_16125 [Candidatus Hodarchaeota archaeon]